MMTVALLLKSTAVLTAGLTAAWLARRNRAAVRHVLLAASFVILLLLPLVSSLSPSVEVPVPTVLSPVADNAELSVAVDEPVSSPVSAETDAASIEKAPSWEPPSLADSLFAIWIVGAALSLLPVVVGLWQIRRLRRSASPWRDGQPLPAELTARTNVQLLRHETLPGPMTCGVFRPAVILPADAESWPPEDVTRALVHELEHVRRLDWLTLCGARAITAIYWFHPLVWIAWRKLSLEAERACDDAVLRSSRTDGRATDDTAYADQLLHLAQRLSASAGGVHVAMANRRDLSARIFAVLDTRRPRGRAGRSVILAAVIMAASFVAALSPLRLVAVASGDGRQAPQATFEVVSVKPCVSEPPAPRGTAPESGSASISADRLTLPCLTPEQLIGHAFVTHGEPLLNNWPNQALDNRSQWIKGLPGWARTEKFAIEAKADRIVDLKVLRGPMLARVLEDRFKLKLHRDVEQGAMYALRVAKGGIRMTPERCKPVAPGLQYPDQNYRDAVLNGATPNCGLFTTVAGAVPGSVRWVIGGMTMTKFKGILSGAVDRQVIDETQLDGEYTVRLEYVHDEHTRNRPKDMELPPPGSGPNIFAALEKQLGLSLVPTTAPRGQIIVDHIERPVPDEIDPPLAEGPSLSPGATQVGAVPARQRYEVASIRPCTDESELQPGRARGAAGGTNASISPGRFTVPCVTLEQLIYLAYASYGSREDERLENDYFGTASDPGKIRGGPDWVHSHRDKWQIEATAPGVSDRLVLMGTMLRTLLEERFKLKIHRDSERASMYALRLAKGGLKLKPIKEDDCGTDPGKPAGDGKLRCGFMSRGATEQGSQLRYVGFRLEALARALADELKMHVIDETGVTDRFVMELFYRSENTAALNDAPSISTALDEQLGLRLDKITGSRGFIVVDHAERPKPDLARAAGSGR